MELLVIGAGYVGLVTGACFSEMGYKVTCLDIDEKKIELLNAGFIPIYEAGLQEMVQRNIAGNRLHFVTSYEEAVKNATIIFLALPTPSLPNGDCDKTALLNATREVARHLSGHKTIVVKSTVPVGTSALIRKTIQDVLERRESPATFDVVSNPEFLKEGCAVQDFMRPDRVIIGCDTNESKQLMKELYHPFMFSQERILFMDTASAELSKYAANAMLATRISFMNWLSYLAEKTGADITQIRKGIGSDRRIGYDFLWAGAGFGGSCFPKDLRALRCLSEQNSTDTSIIDAVISVNEQQKRILPKKIKEYFALRGGLKGKTIALLGLAFKPETDDMREAPSLVLIEELVAAGCYIKAFDPVAMENAKKQVSQLQEAIYFATSEMDAVEQADAVVLVTEWKQFRLLNFSALLNKMKGKVFFDGRNQYDPQKVAQQGIDYISIGRSPSYSVLAQTELVPKKETEHASH